jgi:hypothetical protein
MRFLLHFYTDKLTMFECVNINNTETIAKQTFSINTSIVRILFVPTCKAIGTRQNTVIGYK